MVSLLKHWRESASIMLVSRGMGRPKANLDQLKASRSENESQNAKRTKWTQDFEVLMLKRSSKTAFMPNLHVFPGGVASDSDFSKEWLDVFDKAGQQFRKELFGFLQKYDSVESTTPEALMFRRKRDDKFSHVPSEIAFRICAIRETFEESGILLARNLTDLSQVSPRLGQDKPVTGAVNVIQNSKEWRKRVEGDAAQFLQMCRELSIVPDVWSLYTWSNWLTPAHQYLFRKYRRRFNTAFYVSCLEEMPNAVHDAGETTHSQWDSCTNFLIQTDLGLIEPAAPQEYEIRRLLNFQTQKELLDFCWKRVHQEPMHFTNVIIVCKDGLLLVLPGDDLFPEHPDIYAEKPPRSSEETMQEMSQHSKNMNRFLLQPYAENPKDKLKIECNIEMADGHVRPVLQSMSQSKI